MFRLIKKLLNREIEKELENNEFNIYYCQQHGYSINHFTFNNKKKCLSCVNKIINKYLEETIALSDLDSEKI